MNRSKIFTGLGVAAMVGAMSFNVGRAHAAGTLSDTDKKYLDQATEEVLGEASLSRIADKHAKNEDVKKFASEMVKGSEKMEKELHVEADKYGYVVPAKDAMAMNNDKMLHKLEDKPGFDKAYLDEQVKDLGEMVKLWDKAAEKSDLEGMKKWFTEKSVTLKSDLERATALQEKAGS